MAIRRSRFAPQVLLAAGADTRAAAKDGTRPLHAAVMAAAVATVQVRSTPLPSRSVS